MSVRYVFCINTGRSGSDYLTGLLSQASNAVSVHEGFPMMNGLPMRQYNEGDEEALRALMPLKLAEMRKASKGGRHIYCETNHSFIKGWGELLPDTYIPQGEIGVIILRRDPERIVHSMLRVHDVPGATERNRIWLLTPGAQRNLGEPEEDADRAALCRWYIEEIELRAQAYQERYPEITYVECELEQLNDYGFVREMFETFGLVPSPELEQTVGKALNKRSEWPRRSMDELLAPPRYPSADSLAPTERDTLVAAMIEYLQENKADQISAMEPDYAMGGSLRPEATRIVAYAEEELEAVFRRALAFTETETILMLEFLYQLAPHDVFLISVTRHPPPGLWYTLDFNYTVSAKYLFHKLGWIGLIKMLGLMVRGIRKRDPTHRQDSESTASRNRE